MFSLLTYLRLIFSLRYVNYYTDSQASHLLAYTHITQVDNYENYWKGQGKYFQV